MFTGPDVATKRCRTLIMWTIEWPAIFTIRTATTATTTVPWRLLRKRPLRGATDRERVAGHLARA
jgi:hypothetical protein